MPLSTLGFRPLTWGLSLVLLLAPLAPGLASSADMETLGNATLRDQSVPLPANTTQELDARDAPDTTNATNTPDRPHLDADLNTTSSEHELIELPGADGPCTDDPNVVNECGDEMNGTLDMGDNDILFDGGRVWFENGALDGAGDGGGLRFGGDRVCTAFATIAGCESRGSDIDAVHTGFGLGGGGDAGAVTLFVDSSEVQVRVEGTCGEGAMVTAIHADGQVSCALDQGRQLFAGEGLVLDGSTIALQACEADEVLKTTGSGQWTCATDIDTDTTYAAGGGLELAENAFSLAPCAGDEVLRYDATSSAWTCSSAAPSTITADHIQAGAITPGKLSACSTDEVLRYDGASWSCEPSIRERSVDTEHIANGAIRIPHLAQCPEGTILRATDDSWTCEQALQAGSVTADHLQAGAITSPAIADGAILASHLGTVCDGGEVLAYDSSAGGWACASVSQNDTLGELACTDGQVAKWTANTTTWACAEDIDTDTTYDGTDFALSNQACPAGELVAGVDATGALACALDQDTTSETTNIPWSNVTSKPAGFADDIDDVGITEESDPTVNALAKANLACADTELAKWNATDSAWGCAPDTNTDTLDELNCNVNEIARWTGIDTVGGGTQLWVCDSDWDTTYDGSDFTLSDQACPAGEVVSGVDANGQVTCAPDAGASLQAWLLGGNAGTTPGAEFLGTTDASPLELKANGSRVMRYEPGAAPNVLGGASTNILGPGVQGATIAGGGTDDSGSGVAAPNRAGGNFSTIGGGEGNRALGEHAFVGGGGPSVTFEPTGPGGEIVPVFHEANTVLGDHGVVAGGSANNVTGPFAAILGGLENEASGSQATIGGGEGNLASGANSVVAGGEGNLVDALLGTVGGGGPYSGSSANRVLDDFGVVGGGTGNLAGSDDDDPTNDRWGVVGGGRGNSANGTQSTVGGGHGNTASGIQSTVGGGDRNTASNAESTVGGGESNTASGTESTVGGGHGNTASGADSTVGGGHENTAASVDDTVGGGGWNTANGGSSTVGGGQSNTASGFRSTVPGGLLNTAGGDYSFAAGRDAQALHDGAFVWSDSSSGDFASTAVDQFLIEADGGVGINTTAPEAALHVSGDARIEGTVRMGDESVGATPPHGTLTRQVITRTSSSGSPVAATDLLSLERDGTNGGFQIRTLATIPTNGPQTVACTGITETGAAANAYVDIAGGTASGTVFTVYDDSESVHKLDCSFGNPWGGGGEHYTDVELTRRTNDFWWMGTVTTTFSQ